MADRPEGPLVRMTLAELKAEFDARRRSRSVGDRRVAPEPAPRYDEVWAEGRRALADD